MSSAVAPEPIVRSASEVAISAGACHVKSCRSRAPFRPVLHIAQHGRLSISFVTLPAFVCSVHRVNFRDVFFGEESRLRMSESLRSCGRAAPDWSRTTLEFIDQGQT
jgi:hypothetical protein